MKDVANIFTGIPDQLKNEAFEDLLKADSIRIERILSQGHSSPEAGWYDQDENEWVMVLEGSGEITFENGKVVLLSKGDYLNIPSHSRHKVSWTDPDKLTVWLAIFYR